VKEPRPKFKPVPVKALFEKFEQRNKRNKVSKSKSIKRVIKPLIKKEDTIFSHEDRKLMKTMSYKH
jgi:DNA-directed RNA polymerase specialized sigma54-like protein